MQNATFPIKKILLTALALECTIGLRVPRAQAAIIEVDFETCSLAEAIRSANTDSSVLGCEAGQGADEIRLPENSSIVLDTALDVLTEDVRIIGNHSIVSRAHNAESFSLLVVEQAQLRIDDITLHGGASANTGYRTDYGSAVRVSNGSLELNHVTVEGNSGVAIALFNSRNALINKSTIRNNIGLPTYYSGGGGIHVAGSDLHIVDSRITANSNQSFGAGGGGVYISNQYGVTSNVSIHSSSIDNNTSVRSGGGISVVMAGAGNPEDIQLEIVNTTISGNTTGENGGGIACNLVIARIISSTISDNEANGIDNGPGYGGGISCGIGFPPAGSQMQISHSIISGNRAEVGREVNDMASVFFDQQNILGYSSSAGLSGTSTAGSSDLVPVVALNALIQPLFINEAHPVFAASHALSSGSPAIDFIELDSKCSAWDQNGRSRPQDGDQSGTSECDAGAVEYIISDVIFADGFDFE